MLTASNYGTIKHFPSAELRRVGEEVGVRLLGAVAAADPTQVRRGRGRAGQGRGASVAGGGHVWREQGAEAEEGGGAKSLPAGRPGSSRQAGWCNSGSAPALRAGTRGA